MMIPQPKPVIRVLVDKTQNDDAYCGLYSGLPLNRCFGNNDFRVKRKLYNNRLGFNDIFVGMRAKTAAPPAATIVRHSDCAGREARFLLYLAVEAERHSMVSFTPLPGRCMPAMTRWFFFT